ncbi:Lysophospholipase L1 [Alteromonadaceae bacterium Bs31]|nr:Lysophospholipase L1 [Alteromonadaceae bacterium Bs31]
MKHTSLLRLLALYSLFSASFASATIFIAGDSTAARYDQADQQGWGALLQDYLDSTSAKVDNRARGGRSTRTYISEGSWQTLVDDVQAGDVVLIQFGHNDASKINDKRRARGTLAGIGEEWVDIDNQLTLQQERVYSFGHYLRKMVAEVKAKGATPVLLSLTVRNIWQADRIERGSGSYGWWSYQIAWETDTAFIDVTNPVANELEYLGLEKTAQLYVKDHTHFTPQGARLHVEKIVAALKGLKRLDIAPLLSEKGQSINADSWAWLRLPFPADKNKPSVFMIGDSTVRNGAADGANGEWGWGDFISEELNSKRFNIVNRAIGGFSSRTYFTQGQFERTLLLAKPGDIMLIQFGHNDAAPINDHQRARGSLSGTGEHKESIINLLTGKAEEVHSYGWYLRQMAGSATARGVRVVLCSPVPRKIWQGRFIEKKQNTYPAWAQKVARESGLEFIDLNTLVSAEYEKLGKRKVNALFADKHTHTSKEGAQLSAKLLASALRPMLGL